MNRKRYIGLTITVLLATLALSAPAQLAPGPPGVAPIKLRAATFKPALGEQPDIA